MHTEQTNIRIPRPAGLTVLCRNLNSNKGEPGLKKDILRLVIANYVNNAFTFLGSPMSVTEISIFLKESPKLVMREIARYSRTLASIADPEAVRETQQALTGLLLQQVMTDRAKVSKQADTLVAAQGGTYKPFVTKEVNSSLKNLMDSSKGLMEVAKLLQGSAPMIQNNIQNNGAEHKEVDAIGPNEAVQMLHENDAMSLLESADKKQALSLHFSEMKLPEVVASKQNGYETVGDFALAPTRKPTHTERVEEDGEIQDGVEDTDFEEMPK